MSKQTEILSSSDYEKFGFFRENRPVDPCHVARIKESFEKHFDLALKPINVTKELMIIDGQHRFAAAKELNLPIYYVIDQNYESDKLVVYNTTSRVWSVKDYIGYYVAQGKSDYLLLQEFIKDLGWMQGPSLIWATPLGDETLIRAHIKKGIYKFGIEARTVEAAMNAQRFVDAMIHKYKFTPSIIFNQCPLHKAMKQFFTSDLVNVDQFFEKLPLAVNHFRACLSVAEYMSCLVAIYNFRMSERLKIELDRGQVKLIS